MEVPPKLLAKHASGKWKRCMEAGGGMGGGGAGEGAESPQCPCSVLSPLDSLCRGSLVEAVKLRSLWYTPRS